MNVASEMADQGNRVAILVHDGEKTAQYQAPPHIALHNLKGPPADWAFRGDIAEVRRVLEKEKPLVYFPNGGHCGYAAAAQVKKHDVTLRVIGVAHADEPYYYDTLKYYEPVVDRFIGVSYAIVENLKQHLPVERHMDIICLPYGVIIPKEIVRKPGGMLKVLYAGRIAEHQKRVSRLADFAAAVEAVGVSMEFHIAGDGPEKTSLERAMGNRAIFHGSLAPAEVQSLMNLCDIIVQFSDFEGTSLTMLEAMAAGMVPVMSAVSGIDAVIKDGVSGFLQPIGDVKLAAAQISRLHLDRELLGQVGEMARQTVTQDFSIVRNAETISRLCRTLRAEPAMHQILAKPAFPISKELGIFYDKATGKIRSEINRLTRPTVPKVRGASIR
jgi:glycosyltransferase involved in cell wall biosynthesis